MTYQFKVFTGKWVLVLLFIIFSVALLLLSIHSMVLFQPLTFRNISQQLEALMQIHVSKEEYTVTPLLEQTRYYNGIFLVLCREQLHCRTVHNVVKYQIAGEHTTEYWIYITAKMKVYNDRLGYIEATLPCRQRTSKEVDLG